MEKPNGPSVPLDGIAGALARALAERSKAFHHDSDSDSDSDADGDSDSEWDEWRIFVIFIVIEFIGYY